MVTNNELDELEALAREAFKAHDIGSAMYAVAGIRDWISIARRSTSGSDAEALAGRTVSVDVSTCDDDAGHRIFAELTCEVGSDGTTLIAIETSRNFKEPASGSDGTAAANAGGLCFANDGREPDWGGYAAAEQAADRADQPGFEAWATSHGGLPLDKAGDAMRTDDGLALPTYKFGRTEIAWRAWANRNNRATSGSDGASTAAPAAEEVRDERALFEAWAQTWTGRSLSRVSQDGPYMGALIQNAWAGWQARAAMSASQGKTEEAK